MKRMETVPLLPTYTLQVQHLVIYITQRDLRDLDPPKTPLQFSLCLDKDELFVPSAIHFEIIYLRPDKPATIPCRVTNPKIKVSLHREVPAQEIAVDGTQISYNPTKGFIIQNPSPEHKGAYYCKANSTTKTTPQISTKYQLLYVEGKRRTQ